MGGSKFALPASVRTSSVLRPPVVSRSSSTLITLTRLSPTTPILAISPTLSRSLSRGWVWRMLTSASSPSLASFTKHVPEKVMEHCKVFFSKLNVGKVVRACERARLYSPSVYLYMADKQFDNAVKVQMDHATAWDNDTFLDSITKVRNAEIMYKAVSFYLTQHPLLFTRMMEVLEETIDHSRVVNQLRRTGYSALQLGQEYMKSVQKL